LEWLEIRFFVGKNETLQNYELRAYVSYVLLQNFVARFTDELLLLIPRTSSTPISAAADDDIHVEYWDDDEASESAGSNVIEMLSKRLTIDIIMKLPIIVIPVSSRSTR